MRKPEKVIYYSDPVHDDFAGTHIETCVVDRSYPYRHGRVWHAISHILYYPIALPLVWLLHRVIQGVKFQNRSARKAVSGPVFLYGNHTAIFDAYTPALLSFGRRASVLAGPDAFSIKGLRTIVQMLGGIAIPNRASGMKHFYEAVEDANRRGYDIAIFPEAHIWPYYPFADTSFAYPVRLHTPVIAYFAAYEPPQGIDRLLGRKATRRIYVSEPFYPDPNLPERAAKKQLRDQVYAFMEQTAKAHSTEEVIRYVQKQP